MSFRLDAAGEGQRSASKILLGGLQLSSLRYLISTSPPSTNRSLSPIPRPPPPPPIVYQLLNLQTGSTPGRYARSVKLSVDPNPVVKRNGEDNRFDIASFIDALPVLLEPQPPQSHLVVAAVDATTNDEKVQVVRRLAPPKHYNYGEYERPTNCPYAWQRKQELITASYSFTRFFEARNKHRRLAVTLLPSLPSL
ncbi:hypothetical protein YC2023_100007 [Brassica napus]